MIFMALRKKSHPNFNIPNYGGVRSRVKSRWRKQRGIDNKKRMKKNFAGSEPTIGYRNPEELRGVRASGKRAVVIHNVAELKELASGPGASAYEVLLAGALSRKKRLEIIKLADQSKINVANRRAL
jgi:large subunit ribosomal protein L32e